VHEFLSDRTRRPRDEHALAGEERLQGVVLDAHRRAAQQVLQVHVPDVPQRDAAGQPLARARQELDPLDAGLADGGDDLLQHAGRRRGNGDEHLVHGQVAHDARQRVPPAQHLQPLDVGPLLRRIVVRKPDGPVSRLAGFADRLDDARAGGPRTVDQQARAVAAAAPDLQRLPLQLPPSSGGAEDHHAAGGQDVVHQQHGPRKVGEGVHHAEEQHHRRDREQGEGVGLGGIHDLR